jgi:3-deoxy-D-manno-octulosonic-acid transferase
MWILYQFAVALALVVTAPVLLARRGRHYVPTLHGRLGGHRGGTADAPLWIHAVSVGEARVGATLARRMPPDWPLLMTTVTPTGQQQAAALCGDRASIAYLPFDLGFAVRRFLHRFRPRALMLVEGDYWPLVLRHARRRGMPVVVVNGRVGDRSFGRLRRVPRFTGWLLGCVDHFAVQTTDDRERLLGLGVAAGRITVTGNLKFDAPQPTPMPAVEALLGEAAAGRPILVAGSTMGGEEERVLEAFAAAGGGARSLLVLAPRHPERWGDAEARAREAGHATVRRSALPQAPRADVVVLDSLGELPALYRLAAAAFVGGTLVPTGGHNPLEPALHGVPLAVGPSMENFRQIADAFDEAQAWQRVADADALSRFFRRALDEPAALRPAGARGRELVAANRGATERTLDAVMPALREGMR